MEQRQYGILLKVNHHTIVPLSHCGLVMPYGIGELGQHYFDGLVQEI